MERRIDRALNHDPAMGADAPDGEVSPSPPGAAGDDPLRGASAVETGDDPLPPPAPQREALLDGADPATPLAITARIASGPIDRASLLAALLGGAAYLALAVLSLLLAGAGDAISPIWLPNACAAAFLLRARLSNEWPFLVATLAASLVAYGTAQLPDAAALAFSFANVVEIIVVLALTRQTRLTYPDMTRLDDLVRFVWAGGLAGPLLAAILCLPVLGGTFGEMRAGALTRFLTDSTAMVLIVPTILLLVDRITGRVPAPPARPLESLALLLGGMTCALLVFEQTHYPLLVLIQPITLLHAFRLGSLGTALLVAGVAMVAAGMTWAGHGPIAAADAGPIAQLHLLQAFVAANFLTGLPVAAILAGRDRMIARLEAGKREVDLLADNITDAVLRFDLAGVCTYASPSVRDILGMPPATCLGHHAAARLHPDTRDRTLLALGRLLDGTSDKERVTYRRLSDDPDGAPVFLEADCAVVHNPETGARESVVVAARDVTERVELELLLTRARRHAENAARVKSEFLANMSHEIRTPMNGVLGFAELMLQGDLAADQRRYADLIVQSGRSMMMLLNDVLDLSKIESGQFSIDHAPVNLDTTLAECAALHRLSAEQKGLMLDYGSDDAGNPPGADGGPWIITDGLRLRQILLNLIGNAVKFTDSGTIRVSYAMGPGDVRVTVADTGIGISPARLETIFHPFTQGESDMARRFGGTGLGLSISRQLAALLGGRIEVDSAPGAGSRFALILPAALAQPELADALPGPPAPEDLPIASRILLVEDHDLNRELVTEMLERCGQAVEVAHDGNEGIAMVIDSIMRGRPYDLVLMDVQMPDCDGYAATRAIRAEGIGPGLMPVIALTANAFPEDIAAARAAGMQGHLAKPVVFAQLARALQRWLPTRIVESSYGRDGKPLNRASALARSPRLVARWHTRRREAVAALRAALDDGTLHTAPLMHLIHKLAGTAGMFGEPALGECAAALERALARGDAPEHCRMLARQLLALTDDEPAEPGGAQAGGAPR